MPLSAPKEAWTATLASMIGHSAPGMTIDALSEAWELDARALSTALSQADQQLRTLKGALVDSGDPDYVEIGKRHLQHVLGAWPDTLQRHLDSATQADGATRRKALIELNATLQSFGRELRQSALVTACDDNPVAARVRLRDTLAPTVAALGRSTSTRLQAELG